MLENEGGREGNIRRTTMSVAVPGRFPSQARQDLDAIDPKASPDVEASDVLASPDV